MDNGDQLANCQQTVHNDDATLELSRDRDSVSDVSLSHGFCWPSTIVDQMDNCVAMLDRNGEVCEVNQSLLSHCSMERSECIGRPFWALRWWQIDRETNQQLRRAIRETAGGQFVRYEIDVLPCPSREKVLTLDFSLKPLCDSDGHVTALLAEARDISERKRAEREVERKTEEHRVLYERLKEFDQLRTKFFANVSHELRTPLTLILGPIRRILHQAELAEDTPSALEGKLRHELEMVERNAGLLLKRVNSLLDLAKLEAEEMVADYATSDLVTIGRFAASHFEGLAEERDINYIVEMPERLAAEADPDKIHRVLLNLLSNAFRFTPNAGTVAFSLHIEGDRAVYSVQDTGIGIAPDQRKTVFERFRQSPGNSGSGTGLGLSIVKEFVDLHGGEVLVKEAPGGGADFCVAIPLSAPKNVNVRKLPTHPLEKHVKADDGRQAIDELRTFRRPDTTHKLRGREGAPLILIVEDNPDMNAFLAETLSEDYRVTTAFDGVDGMKKALALRPDLILSDMMMPRMSGDELVRGLRYRPEVEGVPIILLTARADDACHIKALDEGAMSYLSKPFSADELLALVRRLTTEHRRSRASLHKAYALLHAVIEGINDAVFVKDLQGRYLMINNAGAQAVTSTPEKMVGKDDRHFFAEETAKQIMEEDRLVIETQETSTWEREATANGVTRHYLATRVPYRDERGKVIGVMGISRDVTAQKEVERELRVAKNAAEAANKAKDRFLAILSHELRTPLTPVLASVNFMEKRTDLPDEVLREFTMIRRNVEMEARLIDDLLDLTRISRGKIELHFEAVDAHACVRRALEICQPDIQARRLEITQALWAEKHFIWADPARVQQVFWNLINNAVKFTPVGGRITLRSRNARSNGSATGPEVLLVDVEDTGVGIEPDVLPRIFSAFEQGERTVTRTFGGLGLGLAITKALVRMHKGTLTADSDGAGKGACFHLGFKTAEENRTVRDQQPADSRTVSPERVELLLVEDHDDTLRMMKQVLQMTGYQVSTATSVAAARELVESQPFQLIISDIGLPDGSGLDVIQFAKSTYPPGSVKGIALSGFGMEEDLRKSRAAGFDQHLIKPVSLDKLESAIQQVLQGERVS